MIGWDQVCRPKSAGGLGLQPLQGCNDVRLAKLAWRFLTQKDRLWRKTLQAKYGVIDGRPFSSPRGTGFASWRAIQHGYRLLEKGLEWNPRDTSQPPRWLFSDNGKFSSASAYVNLVADNVTPDQFNWKALWGFKGPPRYSLTMWLLAHDRLKTGSLLWQRQTLEYPDCERCGDPFETPLHAIRDCSKSKELWNRLVPRTPLSSLWTIQSPKEWIS